MLDEYGCHSRTEDVSAVLQSLPTPLPWDINEKGEVVAATCPEGRVLKPEMFREDATRYALSFCRDARALHGHNHDHNCSFTCIKYVKDNAKSIAKESMAAMTNIVCRFFFYLVLVFTIIEDGVERVKQVRRRGKELIKR